jgi:hypothetical protein
MNTASDAILSRLTAVECERQSRLATPGLNARVSAIKKYQQRRFSRTYADLLESPRYGAASRFFLDELYGPTDFTQRDAQFARVVPGLVRIFPEEIVHTVLTLSELHALSENLDTQMGQHLQTASVDAQAYIAAWLATDHVSAREEQVRLTVAVANQLDQLTRRSLVRNSLRIMRGPARIAGLSELQRFLERGFDTFRAMNGAQEFIEIVESRERGFAIELFSFADKVDSHEREGLSVLSVLP